MARIVLGSLAVVVVGGACLLAIRTQAAPGDQSVTTGAVTTTTAVVVSSLACNDGAGGTLVDVLKPTDPQAGDTVRVSLAACGYQEGQQLAVQYVDGDPTQLSLAGTDADPASSERLLPIGLGIAALLAAAAGVAVWLDSRRAQRAGGGGVAADVPPTPVDPIPAAEAPALPATAASAAVVPLARTGIGRSAAHGRHSLAEFDPAQPDLAQLNPAELAPAQFDPAEFDPARFYPARFDPAQSDPAQFDPALLRQPVRSASVGEEAPSPGWTGQGSSPVDLVFPFPSSLADSLHDELFTHRSVYS